MELKRGLLRAELEWEVSVQDKSRSGNTVIIPPDLIHFPMSVRGMMYADPGHVGQGVYLVVGVDADMNAVVNASDPAHIPSVQGTSFSKMQWVDLSAPGVYKVKAMLIYANKTADAKTYFQNHPDEQQYLGIVKNEGQSGGGDEPGNGENGGSWWDQLVAKGEAMRAFVHENEGYILGGTVVVGGVSAALVTDSLKKRQRGYI
jgi:hypothetical protein